MSKVIEERCRFTGDLPYAFVKEVGVFKITKQENVQHHAAGEVPFLTRSGRTSFNKSGPVIVGDDRKE